MSISRLHASPPTSLSSLGFAQPFSRQWITGLGSVLVFPPSKLTGDGFPLEFPFATPPIIGVT